MGGYHAPEQSESLLLHIFYIRSHTRFEFRWGFPDSSVDKESACNAGDSGSIPGLGDPLEKGKVPTPIFWTEEFHGLYSNGVTRLRHSLASIPPTWMRYLELSNSERQKVEWWLPGAGGEGKGELFFSRSRVSVWDDEKVLAMDGGNGCTTM